ncbi:MAG: cysteine desulfurase family protein [Vicinamibacterales bacterium]
MKRPIYLDYHATTPVDPRVVESMLPFFTEDFGNASSRNHAWGWTAAAAVDEARAQVARIIGANARDIVFTSGATESNNLAIIGSVRAAQPDRRHVITVTTEHPSVLDTCRALEHDGCTVAYVPVASDGRVDPDSIARAFTNQTCLVSVMAANNEIGVLHPLPAIGELVRERDALFHVDASQAVGKVPFDVETVRADLVSFTAHKIYGPKGIGALYVRKRSKRPALQPLLHGGGHERGLRPGTLNVPGIVGFGRAAALCMAEHPAESTRIGHLRDALLDRLQIRLPTVHVNGSLEHRLPGNLNVAFPGIEPEPLKLAIDDLAVSFGAACTTGTTEPSHVLAAVGMPRELALASVRFGLGRWTTAEEVEYAADRMATIIGGLARVAARG